MTCDDNFLKEVGLERLPISARADFADYVRRVLELRVGAALIGHLKTRLQPDQLVRLKQLLVTETGHQAESVTGFLSSHQIDYAGFVKDQLTRLKKDLLAAAPAILAATRPDPAAGADRPA